jgi:EAL domain-containing protein (putative c-di-GMP-specific phosphodiesterase class I)/ActR/RegA family two-component response regulator
MKKILVIEDEPTIRDLIADLLEAEDFISLCAQDGATGLKLAAEEQPDLVLCDIMMPEMDGYSVLAALRQNLSTAALPFIFLTAKADKPDVRRGMVMGADDYITKPFGRDELLDAIHARLKKHKLQSELASLSATPIITKPSIKVVRMRQALERGEFFVEYQPQVHVASGRVVSAEALVRWRSPDLGLVSPAEFIPLAEETELIIELGEWVLTTVCQQATIWKRQGIPISRLAVNLSSVQFKRADLPQQVERVLNETGLPPNMLDLELTESLLIQNVEMAIAKLNEIRALGIRVSIDDFGTGYASLGYLQHFPFDILKLDQCFVRNVDSNPKNAAITIALIQMAHSLGLQVIAEGVETEAERDFLLRHNCDVMQGYLFGRSLPPSELENLLLS